MQQTTPGTRSVTVELDIGGEPISGSVGSPAAPPRQFSGWLELIAALYQEATATTKENE